MAPSAASTGVPGRSKPLGSCSWCATSCCPPAAPATAPGGAPGLQRPARLSPAVRDTQLVQDPPAPPSCSPTLSLCEGCVAPQPWSMFPSGGQAPHTSGVPYNTLSWAISCPCWLSGYAQPCLNASEKGQYRGHLFSRLHTLELCTLQCFHLHTCAAGSQGDIPQPHCRAQGAPGHERYRQGRGAGGRKSTC